MLHSGKSKELQKIGMKNILQSEIVQFTSGVHTESTRKNYVIFIRQFRDYCEKKSYDSLLLIKPDEVKRFVESFVIYSRNEGLVKRSKAFYLVMKNLLRITL